MNKTINMLYYTDSCKYRLPCGWCDRRNMLCTQQFSNIKQPVFNQLPKTELNNEYIPEACRTCSSHPSNGGSGLCCCSLAYPELNDIQISGYPINSNVINDSFDGATKVDINIKDFTKGVGSNE